MNPRYRFADAGKPIDLDETDFPIDASPRQLLIYRPMNGYFDNTDTNRLWWRWTLHSRSARP